jgi:creatinine amidohydrolase
VSEHLRRSRRVLVPLGSTEQHGAHGPLATDAILASAVCERAAELTDALVAPALPFGISGEHASFAGLISLAPASFVAVVRDIATSLGEGGFARIVFVNGHNTNLVALHAAVIDANARMPSGCVSYWLSYWDALSAEDRAEYLGGSAGIHANEGETSATLAVDAALVRRDRLMASWPKPEDDVSPAALSAYLFAGRGTLGRIVPAGTWGDPTKASSERGAVYLDRAARAVARVVEETDQLIRRHGVDR